MTRRSTITDTRFDRGLYTVPQAARLVGMNASTLATWVHGYQRMPAGRPVVKQGPVVTSVASGADNRVIPFIGLVEATVVQAFRRTNLPMQRIRKALQILADQGELDHALASRQLYTDGAAVLYDYARRHPDDPIKLLTVVASGQRVFHDVILDYLTRITFDQDPWATSLIVPVTEHSLLQIRPRVAGGEPLFIVGGAPLSAVRSRFLAGEPVESIAADYEVPCDHIVEALGAVWPSAA